MTIVVKDSDTNFGQRLLADKVAHLVVRTVVLVGKRTAVVHILFDWYARQKMRIVTDRAVQRIDCKVCVHVETVMPV